MKISRKWYIHLYLKHWHFTWKDFRFNGGGYLYGGSPYYYWRICPIEVRKYV